MNESKSLLKKNFKSLDSIEKCVLEWKDISISLTSSPTQTPILQNISGFSNPQQILAIMGPSGSGKTSLVSVLASQLSNQSSLKVSGQVFLNKKPISDFNSHEIIKLVPQQNIIFEFLTPYEFLSFTLGLKSKASKNEIEERVNFLLEEFKLTEVKHSIIGDNIVKGISGGEKKRLCIAAELLLFPSVLILDEPLSGLDSYLAKIVMRVLRKIADYGVNVILTVHQPGKSIYELIDRLVLVQEGRAVYQGKRSEAEEYFKTIGLEIPVNVNSSDYYMKLLRVENRHCLTEEETRLMKKLSSSYEKTDIWRDIVNLKHCPSQKDDLFISFFKSFRWLIWREYLNYKRNPLLTIIKFFQLLVFAVLIDLAFNNQQYDLKSVDNRKGALLCSIFIMSYLPSFCIPLVVSYERKIALKELRESLYNIYSYYFVKLIVEIPVLLFAVLSYAFTVYYVVNFNDTSAEKIIIFILSCTCSHFVGMNNGFLIGALSVKPIYTIMITNSIAIPMLMFSGLFNNPGIGPGFINWAKYLAGLYYVRNGVLKNEFDDLEIDSDVQPRPNELYDITGEIHVNLLISLAVAFVIFWISCVTYGFFIYRSRILLKSS